MKNRALLERLGRGAALCLVLLCCLLVRTPAAQAAKTVYPPIYLECGEGDATQRVILWEYGTNTTFFLPAGFDTADMRLVYSSPINAVSVDGRDCPSGSRLSIDDLSGSHKIKYRKISYQLRIMTSANLPAIFLTTESGTLAKINANKHHKEAGTFRLFGDDGALLMSEPLEHVKGRGNSTFLQPKRPYQIKFIERIGLFGMQKKKKWVLLANH